MRVMLNRANSRERAEPRVAGRAPRALAAEADDKVRVVILGGVGPMFSSGHDLGSKVSMDEIAPARTSIRRGPSTEGTAKGAEALMLQEWHYFFENTRRWRNLRKITIGQAHGDVYAAGLMLWACDLIVCGGTAPFADVVGTRLGMCGVEYFAHPWEFGPRNAKELAAHRRLGRRRRGARLGMVSKVFPVDELAVTGRWSSPSGLRSCPR